MTLNDELRRVFREEATELIEAMMDIIPKLSRSEGTAFESNVEDILRTAHNLKGAATSTGFGVVESLAHAFEGVMAQYRGANGPLENDVVSCAIETFGVMQDAVESRETDDMIQEALERLAAMGGDIILPSPGERSTDSEAPPKTSQTPRHSDINTGNNTHSSDKESAVRVNTSRLDRLMGFIGDFLMYRTRLADRYGRQVELYKQLQSFFKAHPENQETLTPILAELRRLTREGRKDLLDFSNLTESMNETAKQLRTVPLRGAVHVWRRVVREACQICHKDIQLDVDVGRIEIDRYVLERITDPVMHILRNAVDHGIENPDERQDAGKPPNGRISISAVLQGAMIRLAISDDGRGIDLDRVKQKAIDGGLITSESASQLRESQIADFVFRTGFSTAAVANRISGRGVGLDVVRSQLEELGGSVRISPNGDLGGTTITLAVPVSILSSEGLFVRVGEARFALPIESVVRTLRVRRNDLMTADGKSVIKTDTDDPIRVLDLADLMGVTGTPTDPLNVVVLARSRSELGIIVDEVVGLREYVIHALPWNFKRFPGINGAILEADGSIALLIDVLHIFESEHRRGPRSKNLVTRQDQKVLLVDDSLSSRTLQRSMLKADGYDVTLAADGHEAWELLNTQSFDLVVTDVQMPKMDGFELTKRIRDNPKIKDLPVILVTSLTSQEDRAKGAEAGADDYLVKGTFDQTALLSIVSRYLGG